MGNICKKMRLMYNSSNSNIPKTPTIELGYNNYVNPIVELDSPEFKIDITKNKIYQRRIKRNQQLEKTALQN